MSLPRCLLHCRGVCVAERRRLAAKPGGEQSARAQLPDKERCVAGTRAAATTGAAAFLARGAKHAVQAGCSRCLAPLSLPALAPLLLPVQDPPFEGNIEVKRGHACFIPGAQAAGAALLFRCSSD